MTSVLGDIDYATFLKDYWQKKPCLIRGAYPDTRGFISREELAGLSLESGLESRLVIEKAGEHPWQVLQGPFRAQSFKSLPPTHWSLLVQGVERVSPHASALLDDFRFLPNWRLDDVMISYAPDQGSVGPHVDNYDVFLIQAAGRRLWKISAEAWPQNDFIPGLDLKILKSFTPTIEWTVAPGDMVYLPPRWGHHGIALGSSITYSIGFRAPDHKEIVAGFASFAADLIAGDWHYADPDLKLQMHPGEIASTTFERLEQILATYLQDGDALRNWFGMYITEPKSDAVVRRPEEPYDSATIVARLQGGEGLSRTEGGRIAYVTSLSSGIALYADGNAFTLPRGALDFVILLSERKRLACTDLTPFLSSETCRESLVILVNEGFLFFAADWEDA